MNIGGFGLAIGSLANLIALRLAKQPRADLAIPPLVDSLPDRLLPPRSRDLSENTVSPPRSLGSEWRGTSEPPARLDAVRGGTHRDRTLALARGRYSLKKLFEHCPVMIILRNATSDDIPLLRDWNTRPHVLASGAGEWDWDHEIGVFREWREQLIAELDGRPIGFVQIIDPRLEETHYWGEIGPGCRAIDIWLGNKEDLGKGYGTTIMRMVISRCFEEATIHEILIDPMAVNTRAHRFYERLGFRFVERRWFGDDDCYVYRLRRGDFGKSVF